MKINFNARHVTLTDDLRLLVEKKLTKFDKFFPDEAEASVKFSRVRESECLEVTISAKGTLFRAEKTCKTFQMAIDECIDAIERQIRKNKTRLENRLRDGALEEISANIPSDDTEEDGEITIRTKTFYMEPMTTDEAILRMNLLGHTFFVFKDIECGELRIVYRRKLDTFGLIIPKDVE